MKIIPLRLFFPLKVVPLIEVLLYLYSETSHQKGQLELASRV
jgi:hypothetical protein